MTEAELAALVRGLAPIIREQIAKAVSDLTPRVAALEATLTRLPVQEQTLGELRERLVIVETKAALPVPSGELADAHDRIVALETRMAQFSPTALVDLRAHVATLEPQAAEIPAMRERLAVLETKAAAPIPVTLETRLVDPDPALGELRQQVTGLEQITAKATLQLEGACRTVCAGLSERIAVLETRAPVPGLPGKDGIAKDGADGLGFEDLSVEFDGDRTLALKFERGLRTKTFPIVLPFLKYQGVYQDGKDYDAGDVVTWAGSTWHCQSHTSTKPGDGAIGWVLIVKRGRDGKDGKP